MGKKNSKKKGNRAELKIATMFKEQFDDKFSRTPNSGAFASTHSLGAVAQQTLAGDLICPPNFVFSIECKSGYNEIEIIKLISPGSNPSKTKVNEFVNQSCEDAERSGLIPMLVYIKDRRSPLAFFPKNIHNRKENVQNLLSQKDIEYASFCCSYDKDEWNDKWGKEWVIISLEVLLNKTDKKFFFNN